MELDKRAILHLDLDSFFVSVERLLNPALCNRPIIIGGSGSRGVVASCSYETRAFGVHSAMPVKMALKLCPDAQVISGDMESYSRYSHLITDIIREDAPIFEKASIDEFYLDLSGMDRFFGSFRWAQELRQKIMRESGLPISMGLAINKMVSKVATGTAKPNGEREIARGQEQPFLDPMEIHKIPMIGQKTAQFLQQMGVYHVATLRQMPMELLQKTFGKNGRSLWQRAHGIDKSPIVPYHEQKSISTEATFATDTIDIQHLRRVITSMVEKVGFELRQQKKLCSIITVKIRYANFDTVTRQLKIPYTANDSLFLQRALELFDKLYDRRLLIRLVGVRLSGLVHGHYQISLFDDTEESVRLHQAMDHIREKHGSAKIMRASTLDLDKRLKHRSLFSLK